MKALYEQFLTKVVYPSYARSRMRGSFSFDSAGGMDEVRTAGSISMSTCDLCHTPDLWELRIPLREGHPRAPYRAPAMFSRDKWHLALTDLNNPTGNTDTLICNCRV